MRARCAKSGALARANKSCKARHLEASAAMLVDMSRDASLEDRLKVLFLDTADVLHTEWTKMTGAGAAPSGVAASGASSSAGAS